MSSHKAITMLVRRPVMVTLLLVTLFSLRWFTTNKFTSATENRSLQLDADVMTSPRVNTSAVSSADEHFRVYNTDIYDGLDERIEKMEAVSNYSYLTFCTRVLCWCGCRCCYCCFSCCSCFSCGRNVEQMSQRWNMTNHSIKCYFRFMWMCACARARACVCTPSS